MIITIASTKQYTKKYHKYIAVHMYWHKCAAQVTMPTATKGDIFLALLGTVMIIMNHCTFKHKRVTCIKNKTVCSCEAYQMTPIHSCELDIQ